MLALTLIVAAAAEPYALVYHRGDARAAEEARNRWTRALAQTDLGDLRWDGAEIYPAPEGPAQDWVVVGVCPERTARRLSTLLEGAGHRVELEPAPRWSSPRCPALPAAAPLALDLNPTGAWCEGALAAPDTAPPVESLCQALWGLSCTAARARQAGFPEPPRSCAPLLGGTGRDLAWLRHEHLRVLACTNDEHTAWWFSGRADDAMLPVAVWCDQGTAHQTLWGGGVIVGAAICLETVRVATGVILPSLRCFQPAQGEPRVHEVPLAPDGVYQVHGNVVCTGQRAWAVGERLEVVEPRCTEPSRRVVGWPDAPEAGATPSRSRR